MRLDGAKIECLARYPKQHWRSNLELQMACIGHPKDPEMLQNTMSSQFTIPKSPKPTGNCLGTWTQPKSTTYRVSQSQWNQIDPARFGHTYTPTDGCLTCFIPPEANERDSPTVQIRSQEALVQRGTRYVLCCAFQSSWSKLSAFCTHMGE